VTGDDEPGIALATAAAFVWLGMVVAISFVEAPLKFRAPGVTLPIGLGIGRLVSRALNGLEAALAALLLASVALGDTPPRVVIAAAVPVGLLTAQLVAVRPRLTRRSDRPLTPHHEPPDRHTRWKADDHA